MKASRTLILQSIMLAALLSVCGQNKVEASDDLDRLMSLPYVNYVQEPEAKEELESVILHNKQAAYDGLNLYTHHTISSSGAFLFNMEGRMLHEWNYRAHPELNWLNAEATKDGNVIAIFQLEKKSPEENKNGLIKIDWNSNLVFRVDGLFHHDFDIAENGDIFVLSSKYENLSWRGKPLRIKRQNYITIISKDGSVINEIGLYNIFKDNKVLIAKLEELPEEKLNQGLDVFHVNTLEILKKDIEGICKKDDILLTSRNLNLISIIDIEKEEVVWSWGEQDLELPHHATFLENGNIMVFDNGTQRGYSRIIEVNPKTKQITWEYTAEPKETFYTGLQGSNQRLPNGNTLIAESRSGRVFEVTKDAEKVWEWINPFFSEGKRTVVYRIMRYEKSYFDGLEFNYGGEKLGKNTYSYQGCIINFGPN